MSSRAAIHHILVCDDDPALQEVFREVLTDEGYHVTTQSSIVDDKDLLLRLAPDLIVLDLVFSGRAVGLEFLIWIKATPELKGIPVLICTASSALEEETKDRIKELECAFVGKPFDIDELIAAVGECLGSTNVAH